MEKAFGAGAATPAATHGFPPPAPDPDGATGVIPKAIWDGPNGAMLRRVGFLPDDPADLALTPERARAHIPGVAVLPWANF
jgi:hypothetical protein